MLDAALVSPAVESTPDDQACLQALNWTLAETAEVLLRYTFRRRGHDPAEAHWTALRAVLETFQAMANGTADPVVYLASLDPGFGKSSAIVAAAVAMSTMPRYSDTGVLIAVGRLDEARSLIAEMKAWGNDLPVAARTSDGVTNDLSTCDPDAAQILVVSQQALELQTRGRAFGDVSAFFYRGKPRQVRAWDEAWEAGKAITLERDTMLALLDPARKISFDFRNAIEELTDQLRAAEHDALLPVPDWTASFGVSEADLLAQLQGIEGEYQNRRQATASGLFSIGGRTIRVHRENYAANGQGRVFVSFEETHPRDFAPLLVLDASIRVRQTYQDGIAFRGLRQLPAAVQDYSPLTVHLWETSASRSGWKGNGDALVEGIVATIQQEPSERWLVVLHKQLRHGVDVTAQIRRQLPPSMVDNVHFLTWGRHAGTNAYRHFENVLLASNYFLPPLTYLAKTHVARGQLPEVHGFVEGQEVRETMWGEHRNDLLQAACRGRCRQSDGNACKAMDLWIIAARASGIPRPETIDRIFPGARTVRWQPIKPTLRGRAVDAATELDRLMKEEDRLTSPDDFVSYGKLAQAFAMRPASFISRIGKRDDWQAHIVSLGLVEDEQVGRRGGHPQVGLRMALDGEATDRFEDGDA